MAGENTSVQAQEASFNVFNSCAPVEGPRTIPITLQMANNSLPLDFTGHVEKKRISQIQGIFIDNSANDETLSIQANQTGHTITIQPGFQGLFPIFAPNPPRFVVSTLGTAAIKLQFFNFPVTALQWGPGGGGVSIDLEEGNGITITPNPYTGSGTGTVAASVDGTSIVFNPSGEISVLANLYAVLNASNTFTASPQNINTSGSAVAGSTGTLLNLQTNATTVLNLSSIGAASQFLSTRTDGSYGSPTALQNNDGICNFIAQGWNGSAYSKITSFLISADGNWTPASAPTKIRFFTCPPSSLLNTEAVAFTSTQQVHFVSANNFTANGATSASLGSTSPGNATPQEWLTIIDSAGNTRYIPCF